MSEVLASGWDEVGKFADAAGNFVKLEPGESMCMVFVGTIEAVNQTFDKPDGGQETRTRYRCEVHVPGEGKKNFSFGKTVLSELRRQRKKRPGNFDRAVFEIERVGAGLNTKYAIDYLRQLDDSELVDETPSDDVPF